MGPRRPTFRSLDHLVLARGRPLHGVYSDRRPCGRLRDRRLRIFRRTLHDHDLSISLSRLWAVSHRHGYMTAGDFMLGRYGYRLLELAVAVTGILATMPYIALQLVGLEKVIGALGFSGVGLLQHAPITIAIVILALYTYKSGLRAPAMIAFVKDAMIYVFIIAAVVLVPYELGGFGKIFHAAQAAYAAKVAAKTVPAAGLTLSP